jgi:hypothetical protein
MSLELETVLECRKCGYGWRGLGDVHPCPNCDSTEVSEIGTYDDEAFLPENRFVPFIQPKDCDGVFLDPHLTFHQWKEREEGLKPKGQRIVAIVGLPACGKTMWARRNLSGFKIFDDPGIRSKGQGGSLQDLHKALCRGYSCAIIDPMLCVPKVRRGLEYWVWAATSRKPCIEWIWFQNDPGACLANALLRPGKPVQESIKALALVYDPVLEARKPSRIGWDLV